MAGIGGRVTEGLRAFARKRPVRVAAIVLASVAGAFLVSAAAFHLACKGSPQEPGAPPSAQVEAFERDVPGYRIGEESSTYLTIPEWYEVFSYNEYAEWIGHERPSQFPYFAAIGQLWGTYCHAYGATQGSYPFNFGDHLMLVVICTSFSVEYGLKGAWEKTIGWLYEHDSTTTEEDRYAAATAKDYGRFVQVDVWYEYPFGSKAVGVWRDTHFFGPDFPRKMERKVFLTSQYAAEAGYAFVIRAASHAVFGPPDEKVHLWVENMSDDLFAVEGVEKVRDLGNGSYVITVPHWQGFTDVVPVLARNGTRVLDVTGNQVIAMTVLAPRGWNATLDHGEVLWRQDVLTADLSRVVVKAQVRGLHELVPELDARGARIEHLFDY